VVRGLPASNTSVILSDDSIRDRGSPNQSNILATVVLYKCSITQSSTCVSLQTQEAHSDSISILVYDNGPVGNLEELRPHWTYVSDSTNKGLAAAYNCALSQAKISGAQWLLLLDQDSILPRNFLANLQAEISLCHDNPKIAAIVPLVFSGRRQVSPTRPMLGFDRPYRSTQSTSSAWLTAINSAAAIRVSFVESIGGFSEKFWLDYLDYWLFRKIYDTAHSVYVSDIKIDHNLSVANFNHGLEISRYENVLKAEAAFTNQYLPVHWKCVLAVRLLARAIKHAVFTRNKKMALLMLSAAWKQALSISGVEKGSILSEKSRK
jgi:GT2 family glycosyltransferase